MTLRVIAAAEDVRVLSRQYGPSGPLVPRELRLAMAQIVLDHVDKVYPGGVKGVDGLTLDIADGEFMVLVGPSGCGKSTALRSIAGLEDISAGTITIGDRIVNDLPPKDRD